LLALGRAYGKLPGEGDPLGSEQERFLEAAVQSLAEDGKVVGVRLALFAEMMQTRDWVSTGLHDIERSGGIGAAFLEQTFAAPSAPPPHRTHENAARAVLKTLLPEAGTDIKGNLRSYEELLQASGYGNRPHDFAELVRVLDSELRLITPADLEGTTPARLHPGPDDAATSAAHELPAPRLRYYQLTHDYLVPSLRHWLTAKQRATFRGQVELRLAERAKLWNTRRENRQLPSWWEYAAIRCYTRRQRWSPAECTMMKSAWRYHSIRWFGTLLLLALAIMGGIELHGRTKANALVTALLHADSQDVTVILGELAPLRRWVVPQLVKVQAPSEKDEIHRELALLRLDTSNVDLDRLLELVKKATPLQARLVGSEGRSLYTTAEPIFWEQLQKADTPQGVLALATVIATRDPNDDRWAAVADAIVEQALQLQPDEVAPWFDGLLPIGQHLVRPLEEVFSRAAQAESPADQRAYIAALGLARFRHQELSALVRLLVDHACRAPEFHCLSAPLLADRETALVATRNVMNESAQQTASQPAGLAIGSGLPQIDRMANALLLELILGDDAALSDGLRNADDQSLRSTLIHRFAQFGIPPAILASLIERNEDPPVRAAILLGLGEYPRHVLPSRLMERIEPQIAKSWTAANAEAHSAARWLAARWELDVSHISLAESRPSQRDWYVTRDNREFAVIRGRLEHDFALAASELTVEEYRRFSPDYEAEYHKELHQYLDTRQLEQCPAIVVSLFDAMRYCNWLSQQEGLAPSDYCYEEMANDELRAKADYLRLKGYRLPTISEWQCACAAGTTTSFSFGSRQQYLPYYSWYYSNSRFGGQNRSRAVSSLKPNAFGLFDMYGNVWEWVHGAEKPTYVGGSCDNEPIDLMRVERELLIEPRQKQHRIGFRLAQSK
jgi:formylglycine-generating enzyme required for sulfatase activity